jgi:hypothetical protein
MFVTTFHVVYFFFQNKIEKSQNGQIFVQNGLLAFYFENFLFFLKQHFFLF